MNTSKKNSETCTKFETSFVVTKNIKIVFFFLPTALMKNQRKMHYHGGFTCKRGINLADS